MGATGEKSKKATDPTQVTKSDLGILRGIKFLIFLDKIKLCSFYKYAFLVNEMSLLL